MKRHSTNYYNTLIEIAEDSKQAKGTNPPEQVDKKTIANQQFELLYDQPYQWTSDEVLFQVFASRNGVSKNELAQAEEIFFSKGQACFRASPLTKTYGWGVHFNDEGKMALIAAETKEYQDLLGDDSIKKVKAMRNKRK